MHAALGVAFFARHSGPKCDVGVDSAEKVDECIRFSADNCLHGLPSKDTPKASAIDQCVAAIASGTGGDGCNVIQNPELSPACSFLLDTAGTGGSAGTGGTTGTGGSSKDAASD